MRPPQGETSLNLNSFWYQQLCYLNPWCDSCGRGALLTFSPPSRTTPEWPQNNKKQKTKKVQMSLAVMRGRNFCRPPCDSPDRGERSVLTDRCNSRACCGLRVLKRASEGGRLTMWEKGSDGKGGKGGTGMEKVFRVTGYQKKIETSRLRSLCPKEHSGEFVDGCAAYLLYTLSFFLPFLCGYRHIL